MKQTAIILLAVLSLAAGNKTSHTMSADTLKKETAPGLGLEDKVPDFKLSTYEGGDFILYEQLKKHPVLLIFYRGGWCPFCNRHLREVQDLIMPEAKKKGILVAAIAVDRPDYLADMAERAELSFELLSDPDLIVLEPYNLIAQVDDETFARYEKMKFNLEGHSGRRHHKIAVPATMLIGQDGKLLWQFADRNYKLRAPSADVVNAIRAIRKVP